MRVSSYLNAVEIGDGKTILYNGYSMCIDIMPTEIVNQLISNGEREDFNFLLPAEKEHLLKRGHLTTLNKEDELEKISKFARELEKKENEFKNQLYMDRMITFILTYRCNLSCNYCYQADVRKTLKSKSMSASFVDELFNTYFTKMPMQNHSAYMSYLLYGGEPLLSENRTAIERILYYANKNKAFVSTVTNAIMLPQMLDLIGPEKGKINYVQLTLDGDQILHDETRLSINGTPTFEQTVLGLHELLKTKANITIRIHLHPKRLESARILVEYLEKEGFLGHEKVNTYLWSTEPLSNQNLDPEEFKLFSQLFQDIAFFQYNLPTAHFAFLQQILDMKKSKELSTLRYCDICVAGLHCVVDPFGNIYECIDDAGHIDRRIGAFAKGKVNYYKLNEKNVKYHFSKKPECLKCSIVLYCRGGCVNWFRTQQVSKTLSYCYQIKEFVGLTIKSSILKKRIII